MDPKTAQSAPLPGGVNSQNTSNTVPDSKQTPFLESSGITGFARVVVSPDNQKICFESWPPAPEPAMYIANIDGSEIVEVNPNRQSCLWKSDTKGVFYINTTSTTSPVNIFYFDLASQEETNVTAESVTEGTVRRYKIVGLSGDG